MPLVESWPSMRSVCVLLGMPLMRTLVSAWKSAPGKSWSTEYGLRMPADPALAPIPSTGRLFSVSVVTLWLSSPLSVLSNGAASVTVTDSAAEPTSSVTSTRSVCATGTPRPFRT